VTRRALLRTIPYVVSGRVFGANDRPRIGVIGTQTTIGSEAYVRAILGLSVLANIMPQSSGAWLTRFT
jgi:glutamate racemase